MASSSQIRRSSYIGLFTTTLATLMFENLLTRIFSVTMWYHFAFMAVSIAMFGMTVGATIVYLSPNLFTNDRVKGHLVTTSLLFSITIIISFLAHINIPINNKTTTIYLPLTFVLISIPFIFAGINTCLILTKVPTHIGKLYAADLAYLEEFYLRLNFPSQMIMEAVCPHCGGSFQLQVAPLEVADNA